MLTHMEGPMLKAREKTKVSPRKNRSGEKRRKHPQSRMDTVASPRQAYLCRCFGNCCKMLKQGPAAGAGGQRGHRGQRTRSQPQPYPLPAAGLQAKAAPSCGRGETFSLAEIQFYSTGLAILITKMRLFIYLEVTKGLRVWSQAILQRRVWRELDHHTWRTSRKKKNNKDVA